MEEVRTSKEYKESYQQSCSTALSMFSDVTSLSGSKKAGASPDSTHLSVSVLSEEGVVDNITCPVVEIQEKVFTELDYDSEESQSPLGDLGLAFAEGLNFNHNKSFETAGEDFFSGDFPSPKDKKNKKKKKRKGGLQSPNRILAFNAAEQQKLVENKAQLKFEESKVENKRSLTAKTLFRNATFPGPSPDSTGVASHLDVTDTGTVHAEVSEDSEASDQQAMGGSSEVNTLVLMRSNSLPPKSALRGGHEDFGLGPRPKLHVKWAPDVREPVCRSISHTVNHGYNRHHLKKKEHKHRHKGKSSHGDACKKYSHKLRHSNEGGVLRTHANIFEYKEDLRGVAMPGCLVLPFGEVDESITTCKVGMQEQATSGFHGCLPGGMNKVSKTGSDKSFQIAVSDAQATYTQGTLNVDFNFRKIQVR